jgi:hypothetical protein
MLDRWESSFAEWMRAREKPPAPSTCQDVKFTANPRTVEKMVRRVFTIGGLVCGIFVLACGSSTPVPRNPSKTGGTASNPLGGSYVLIPAPSDDQSILGRILGAPPEAGHALDELSQPNPCADKLDPPSTAEMNNTYEDAEELSMSAQAQATLGLYGFRADASRATHFLYKVQTQRQVIQRDTVAYAECCKANNGCGYGYVSALVYGSGEYASAEETRGSGQVDVALAKGGGAVSLKVLSKRNVRGWVAALVKTNDAKPKSVFGIPAEQVDMSSTPDEYKRMYEKHRIRVCTPAGGTAWGFCDPENQWITENEFVRRYTDETSSDELASANSHRRKGTLIGGVGLVALAIGLGVTLAVTLPNCDGEECTNLAMGLGTPTLLSAVFGALAITSATVQHDGGFDEHSLTESDGRFYADQYNRALLRRITRDAQRGRAASAAPMRVGATIGAPAVDRGVVFGGSGLTIRF